MKRILMTGIAAVAAIAAQALSFADASGKIADIVANPSLMGETISQLSTQDAAAFLSRVNAAIADLPDKSEAKVAKFMEVNAAALKNVKPEDRSTILAETFATVPTEALAVINEQFAANLLNRDADPANPVSDADMAKFAKEVVAKTQARTSDMSDANVRNAFAIVTMLRSANGKPETLRDELVGMISDPAARETAKNEWIPAALGEGQEKSYDAMLAASDAGEMPDVKTVLQIAGPQGMDALLSDLSGTRGFDALPDPLSEGEALGRIPRTTDPTEKWHGGNRRGGTVEESEGYRGQSL